MHRQIYVNLPVADVPRSITFFQALGYRIQPQFTNDKAASFELGENLYVMLLDRAFFQTFTPKPLADAHEVHEVAVCLSCTSRQQVDELVAKAVAAGGTVPSPPQDHGFMYGHGYEDLDGHHWELVWMQGPPPAQA